MIATPSLDATVKTATALGFVETACAIQRQGDSVTFAFPKTPLIAFARNQCVKSALDSDVDYLLFWDSDVAVIQPRDFIYLLRDRLEKSGAWVAGGAYRFKNPDAAPTCPVGNDVDGQIEYMNIEFGQTVEVDLLPTGLMLIPRWVLEQVPRPWFHVEDDPETLNVIPEDYYFCKKVRELGGKILCAGEIATVHFGDYPFGFPPNDRELKAFDQA